MRSRHDNNPPVETAKQGTHEAKIQQRASWNSYFDMMLYPQQNVKGVSEIPENVCNKGKKVV